MVEPKHFDDQELRMELVRAHQLHPLIERRGIPHEQERIRLWLAALDAEYLRRFPHAAHRWPWPRMEPRSF